MFELKDCQKNLCHSHSSRRLKARPNVAGCHFARRDRDGGLSLPRLIIPAVQVNMRAGVFPPAEENGTSYFKVPLNIF